MPRTEPQPVAAVRAIDPRLYRKAEIPDSADDALTSLVQLARENVDRREEIGRSMDTHLSSLLLVYAERMATFGLRSRSRERLLSGLCALSLAGNVDVRDALVAMSLLYRSAEEIGVDASALFLEVAFLADGEMREAFKTFPIRRPHDRSIEAMGYRLENDQGRLVYKRLW